MKPIILKNHILYLADLLEIGMKYQGVFKLKDLPEELCKKICEYKDNGNRYSESSRYNYWTMFDGKDDLIYNNAKAAVQSVFIKKAKGISMETFVVVKQLI